MPAKHTVNPQRASAANKPFITEYRLAFKNPLTPKKVGPGSKTSAKKSAATAAKTAAPAQDTVKQVVAAAPAPKSDEKSSAEAPHHSTSLTLPAMMHGAAQANLSLDAYRKRRRMLALDHKKLLHERYNIINGTPIAGESSSGFKEGRRAVVQTFSHIDTITNARSPGYNIITGHDVLSGKTAEEIQTIYASALKPSKPAH